MVEQTLLNHDLTDEVDDEMQEHDELILQFDFELPDKGIIDEYTLIPHHHIEVVVEVEREQYEATELEQRAEMDE